MSRWLRKTASIEEAVCRRSLAKRRKRKVGCLIVGPGMCAWEGMNWTHGTNDNVARKHGMQG